MQAFKQIHKLPGLGMCRTCYNEVETHCGVMVPEIRTRSEDFQPTEGELLVDRHMYCEKCYP